MYINQAFHFPDRICHQTSSPRGEGGAKRRMRCSFLVRKNDLENIRTNMLEVFIDLIIRIAFNL